MEKMNNKFQAWYHRTLGRLIPEYAVLSLISCFLLNSLIYSGTQLLMRDAKHYDLSTELDRSIPFIKEWVLIYLICFVFWGINYILIAREGKEHWFRFAAADMGSRLICAVFFILLPTTNVRPKVTGSGVCSILMRFVYAADMPTNLFPSIHCLVSWFCFIGIRRSRKIPAWYRIFSCVFAIMVCISTQFTKQHYLIDIVGGVLLAEFCYMVTHRTQIYRGLERMFDRLNQRIFGGNYDE
jgi:membrane-associated phospholipid phosphatase